MSVAKQNSNHDHLQDVFEQLESNNDIKAFVYQQINELNPYLLPETQVMVLAKDPREAYNDESHPLHEQIDTESEDHLPLTHRIVLMLKEDGTVLEAEGFGYDIFDAIKTAKDAMLFKLIELQEEMESAEDRNNAIHQASQNTMLH